MTDEPELSQKERYILEMYSGPEVYCMRQVYSKEREDLVHKGLLMWVPSTGWNSEQEYALTELGRKWREDRGWG